MFLLTWNVISLLKFDFDFGLFWLNLTCDLKILVVKKELLKSKSISKLSNPSRHFNLNSIVFNPKPMKIVAADSLGSISILKLKFIMISSKRMMSLVSSWSRTLLAGFLPLSHIKSILRFLVKVSKMVHRPLHN